MASPSPSVGRGRPPSLLGVPSTTIVPMEDTVSSHSEMSSGASSSLPIPPTTNPLLEFCHIPIATLGSFWQRFNPPRSLRQTGPVEYTYMQYDSPENSSLGASSKLLKDGTGPDWVYRLHGPPKRRYGPKYIMLAAVPTMCSVIIATLWRAQTGDTQTAVAIVSYMFMANIGVLILLGIISLWEG